MILHDWYRFSTSGFIHKVLVRCPVKPCLLVKSKIFPKVSHHHHHATKRKQRSLLHTPPVTMAPALLVETPSSSGGCTCSPGRSAGVQKITTTPSSPPDSPCGFEALCHPLEESITKQVDGWFLAHWPFATAKDRKKFVTSAFSQVTCLYFPLAKDDRIRSACELLTILFLIDGKFHTIRTRRAEFRACGCSD